MMLSSAVARLWLGTTRSSCSLASLAGPGTAIGLLGTVCDLLNASTPFPTAAPAAAAVSSTASGSARQPLSCAPVRGLCTPRNLLPSGSQAAHNQMPSAGTSGNAAGGTTPQSVDSPPATPSSNGDANGGQSEAPGPEAAGPLHASRRDVDAAAETVYPSSHDDNLGVQKNWFNSLFSQLNVVHKTGMAPHMAGRQKEVFVAVEREFEALWERHVRGRGLQGVAHRGMLLCCLAIATHRVLRYETGDDELVKEVVRTNLGGVADSVMLRLHKTRLWLLLRLLAEDPYKQAVRFLPSLQGDMASLVSSELVVGPQEAAWTASACAFHATLVTEDATELLPYFCCQYGMQYLEGFAQYGVRVGLEQSLGFGDECCCVRISRPRGAPAAEPGPGPGVAGQGPGSEAPKAPADGGAAPQAQGEHQSQKQ